MGKRKSIALDNEVSQSKSRKSRRIQALESDDEDDNFETGDTPNRNSLNDSKLKESTQVKTTPKRSKKMKSQVNDKTDKSSITIDSNSDEESEKLSQKTHSKKSKISKEDSTKQQVSLEKAFGLQGKSSTSPNKKGKKGPLPAQSNTLDKYFSKNAKPPVSSSNSTRKEVSVNDFFGNSSSINTEKKESVPTSSKSSVLVPDTPEAKPPNKTLNDDSVSTNKKSTKLLSKSEPIPITSHNMKPSLPTVDQPTLSNHQEKQPDVHKKSLPTRMDSDLVIIDEDSTSMAPKTPSKPMSPLKKAWLATTSPDKTMPHVSPQGSSKENTSPPAPTTPAANPKTPHNSSFTTATPQSKERLAGFLAFKQREGPKELGCKKIPEGAPNCLTGIAILVTGVLEHVEREDVQRLVERCGGKFTKSLSKKTSYLVVGREPGQSKISKAEQLGTKILDEDGLFNLVEEKSAKLPTSSESNKKSDHKQPVKKNHSANTSGVAKSSKMEIKAEQSPYFSGTASASTSSTLNNETIKSKIEPQTSRSLKQSDCHLPWVEKYRPKTRKQLIGQHGAASCANKLFSWLENWHSKFSRGEKNKAYNSGFNRFTDDGSSSRAALLSGPPGIGKTTTAQVVCRELGFTYVELNASDKRNKATLDQEVADALKTHSILDLFSSDKSADTKFGQHHCILMDEVDGMAGNEDRGGMNQLIQLIKQTKIPIICMCNDRQSMKVRSLANYCFDLRFQRPRLEQIKAGMMSIACKESLSLPPGAITDIISASNNDVRQILNNLEMWSTTAMTESQTVQDAKNAKKDLKIGPFDVIRQVFSPGDKDTINDKSDLFFQDYSLGPLFVQENYLNVRPYAAEGNAQKTLYLISKAADAIADGDLVSKRIRSSGNWSLLPVQAVYSSVIPGDFMRGPLAGMAAFPSWLGKNSTQSKTSRQLAQISTHMRLATRGGCDSAALSLDYVQRLAERMSSAMKQGDSNSVIEYLDTYHLLKDDMDTIYELATWSTSKDWLAGIDSKTKAALTRTYNKGSHLTPYSISNMTTKRGKGSAAASEETGAFGEEEQLEEGNEEDEDNPETDAMIVKKKPKKEPAPSKAKSDTSSKQSQSKAKPSTSKKSKSKK